MTFKTGVNKFKTKYRLACIASGIKEAKLDNNEILMYLTEKYAHLANKYKLIQKYSTDNSTPQTNLTAGQTTYTTGTGATNIPTDLGDIYAITLNDTDKTPLDRLNITSLQGQSATGTPTGYAIDKTNKILVLNAAPSESYASNSAMRLIIHYCARIEPYTGEATGSYTAVDFTASDFGGSFLTDDLWSDLFITYALGEFIPAKKNEAMQMEAELKQTMPTFYSYDMPYCNGVAEDYVSGIPGSDEGGRV